MKQLLRKSATYVIASVLAVVLLAVGFVTFNQQVYASNPAGRLFTIHDRGEELLVLSDKETIAEVLKDAGLELDQQDAIEPGLDEPLVASEYNVNIYRARPVTVVDGATRQKIVTPYQTSEQIVKHAGIKMYEEDAAHISRSDDLVNDGAGLQLTIERSVPFKFDLYGLKTTARTLGATVGEMLAEKGIQLESSDRVQPSASTPITEGMSVRVWREGKQTVTVEEKIDFPIEQIQDADQEVGYKKIKSKGSAGERQVTYEIVVRQGKEISRKQIASVTVKQPVKQVEIVGIKVEVLANYTADKAAIMAAAGIAESDWPYAAYIIDNENAAWCPIRWQGTPACWAQYREKFPGAESSPMVGYGLCQSTPANKMASAGSDWRTNPVTQMKWCHGYAVGRYGSWQAAYNFKKERGWW